MDLFIHVSIVAVRITLIIYTAASASIPLVTPDSTVPSAFYGRTIKYE